MFHILRSRRVAIWLLVLTLTALVLSTLVPDPRFLTETDKALFARYPIVAWLSQRFTTDKVGSAWPFIGLLGYLALSAAWCSLSRLLNVLYKKNPTRPGEPKLDKALTLTSDKPIAEIREGILKYLKKKGWRLEGKPATGETALPSSTLDTMICRKGRIGVFGSILFHLALTLVLVMAIIASLTNFSGELLITETQKITLVKENLVSYSKPYFDSNLPGVDITLEKFTPTLYKGMQPVDYAATLRVDGISGSETKVVRINQPLKYKDLRLLIYRYGFSPRFILSGPKAHVENYTIFDSYVNLSILEPGSVDSFAIADENLDVTARFFPDAVVDGRKVSSRGPLPKNPVFYLEIKEAGKAVFSGLVHKGEKIKFGARTLEFSDLNYWVDFIVIGIPAYWPVVAVFLLMLAGLLIRYAFPDKVFAVSLLAAPEGSIIKLAGHCRYYPALFNEELNQIKNHLADHST